MIDLYNHLGQAAACTFTKDKLDAWGKARHKLVVWAPDLTTPPSYQFLVQLAAKAIGDKEVKEIEFVVVVGKEGVFYLYNKDNCPTPTECKPTISTSLRADYCGELSARRTIGPLTLAVVGGLAYAAWKVFTR